MKKASLLVVILFLCQSAFSQASGVDTTKIYHYVADPPIFPNQYGSINDYIARHIVYPDSAIHNNIEGKVLMRFVVGADGRIRQAKVIRGIGAGCDTAALTVIREMPDWIPGKQDGKRVPVYVTLPIHFKLGSATLEKALQGLELDRDLTPDKNWTSSSRNAVVLAPSQMPEFPGGQLAMFLYLSQHLRYPKSARRAGIEGTVYVQFVIDEKGNPTEVKVRKGISPACDAEAIRVIEHMPRWEPGKKDGKKVKVYYSLPIRFQLQD